MAGTGARTFHRYSSDDLAMQGGTGGELAPQGPDDFLLLLSSYVVVGGEMFEESGVWRFDTMLAAMHWLDAMFGEDAVGALGPTEYDSCAASLQESLAHIYETGNDEKVTICSLFDYAGSRHGLMVIAYGYWDVFVPDALSYFSEDLRETIMEREALEQREAAGKVERRSAKSQPLATSEWLSNQARPASLDEMREELVTLETLRQCSDLRAPEFVAAFIEACNRFDVRHNG